MSIWDAGTAGQGLNPVRHSASPKIYLFERQSYREAEAERERERERERGLPLTGSLPSWLQLPELRLSEARSQKLPPGLPRGFRG